MTEQADDPDVLRWETLTKTRFDELDRARCVVLVTCSPIEVHGPHLPLGTDAFEGRALARRTLRFLPERHRRRTFLELPFLYTASDSLPQPGSIFFQPTTTVRVLTDLGRSLAAQGFRDILVSNFHGSPRHYVAIESACDRVSRERNVRMVSVFSLLIGKLTGGKAELVDVLGSLPGVNREDLVGDVHAGLAETAQLLALHPELVDGCYADLPRCTIESWLAEQNGGKGKADLGEPEGIGAMLRTFRGVLRFFRSQTYAGAPAAASAELGERILDTLAESAACEVTSILDGKLPPEKWHSPMWAKRHIFVNPLLVRLFNRLLRIPGGIA